MRKGRKTELVPDTKNPHLAELYKKRAEYARQLSGVDVPKYMEENKIHWFKPIEPYQSKILEHIHDGKKIIALVGGSGIGKTTLGAVILASACLGIQPWDKQETVWGRRPVKCRIICTDWEKHAKTVIVPKLKEWLPAGQYTTSKNNTGVESMFNFPNKSSIELMTNKEATIDHSGWEGDIAWGDEQFDRDKFIENLRGLRRPPEKGGMGVFLITMTAVTASWVLDDIVRNTDPAYASVTEIPQDANPYLTAEYKRIYRASMTEDEKIARIYGGWLNLAGLVWKGFKPDLHIIDFFNVPTDWPVIVMIDFHPGKPQAISFYTTDPQEKFYVIDEHFEHLSPEETADYIIRAKISNGWRIKEAYIDPLSKGDVAYMKNRHGEELDAFTIMKERLYRHGIDLQVGSKDQSSGILNVEKLLMGPNKMPLLFFFRTLNKIEKEGHIWEIQRWNYDEDQTPKVNFHFMENLYRVTLTGLKYSKPRRDGENLKSQTEFNVFQPGYGIRESETEFNVWR
jgi:hypothetical protein